jgi:hypothetical protein
LEDDHMSEEMERATDHETASNADRLAYATGQLSEFQALIRFADTKAGAAITIASALLSVLFASYDPALNLLNEQRTVWVGAASLVFTTAFFVAFLKTAYHAFLTFLPRLEKKEYQPTIAFFLDVFHMKEEPFIREVSTMSLEDLLEDTLREVYFLSEILTQKFAAQRRCFQWLRFVLLFWALAQLTVLLSQ